MIYCAKRQTSLVDEKPRKGKSVQPGLPTYKMHRLKEMEPELKNCVKVEVDVLGSRP